MTAMTFAGDPASARPLHLVTSEGWEDFRDDLPESARAWAAANSFSAKAGSVLVLPGANGEPAGAIAGLGSETDRSRGRFHLGAARSGLPAGDWQIATAPGGDMLEEAALGWLFAGYRFSRYAEAPAPEARLVAPEALDTHRLETIAEAEALTRDLINTPSNDMGPEELEKAATELAARYGATSSTVTGEALLDQNFPLIHAVGRASPRAPRLIELRWGSEGPRVTLVGKGVCFDTGGLNLKPGSSMGLMKKDMGGAAIVLGLAQMIMASGQALRLRVLIPAVENSVSGPAIRPGDILTARNGKTVEINNTDAEGRLVLADALTFATEEETDLVISMATLTGAARVAVGPDIAPFFTDDDALAAQLAKAGERSRDPVWRLPFHAPYEPLIEPGIADLDNAPKGGFGGAITAALFLRRFAAPSRYVHFDVYGWQPSPAPGRPKGGFGQGARALFDCLPEIA